MQILDAIDKMLKGKEVRLSAEGRRLWQEEWQKTHGYDQTGKGRFYLQKMDDRGLFQICSEGNLMSDGWSPAYFIELRGPNKKQ